MQAVLWDMNGVLVDDERIQEQAWQQTLDSAGLTPDGDWFAEHFLGRKASQTLQRLYPELDDVARALLLASKERRYARLSADGVPEVPGAADTVRAAHERGIKQAVVTSGSRTELEANLDQLRIRECFEAFVTGRDVQCSKPAPEGFLLGAERLRVDPADCWAVEDSVSGVASAQAAGMQCLAVTTTLAAEELAAADLVVDVLRPSLLTVMGTSRAR